MSQLKRYYKVDSGRALLLDPRGAGRRLPARGPMVRSHRLAPSAPAARCRRHDRHLVPLERRLRPSPQGNGPAGAAGSPRRARAATSPCPGPADGVWEVESRAGPALPAPRRVVLLPLLRPAPRPSWLGPAEGAVARRRATSATATASSGCSTSPTTARLPWTASTRPAEQRWNGDAVGLRRFRRALFPCPTSIPPGPRTRAPRSASSSGARCWSADLTVTLEAPDDLGGLRLDGSPARAAEAARALLPHQLPLHRDHERLQLQVHVVPRRDHGPPPRLHEEGEGLPHPRRDRGEAALARARSTR